MKRKLLLPLFCILFAVGFQSCDKAPEREVNTIESHLKTMEEYNALVEYPVETKEIDSLFTIAKQDIKKEQGKLFKDFGKIKANLYYILRKQEKVIAEAKENSQKVTDAFVSLYVDFLTVQKSLQGLSSKDERTLIKEVGPELNDVINGMGKTAAAVSNKSLTQLQKLELFQAKDSTMMKIKKVIKQYVSENDWKNSREEALRDVEKLNALR